ncbi:putative GPI anchored protein [Leptodontidium sp. MPI-SDFR-AT-0119]|nr:putative GPI anchored protein [Leptodontidium sp. MPI-SDFR-AT-0119]
MLFLKSTLGLLPFLCCYASALVVPEQHGKLLPTRTTQPFLHPGMLHTEQDFTRMRSKVSANASPWITSWNILTANSHAASTYSPRPAPTIYRGSDGVHSQNYPQLYNDVAAAYALALRWKISGDTAYADTAVKVFNAWAYNLTLITGSTDADLAAGIYGYEFANAAEIMRSYSGWSAADQTQFKTMMQNVFYSINHDFLIRHNDAKIDHYWANWDLCNIASMLAIGILTDNSTMYQEAITYFKSGGGNGNIDKFIWTEYTVDSQVLGQGQEAGRDQGHATLDFALAGALAQMAYNQGDDLFAYESNKLLAGSEYCAKYNAGSDVPYTTYTNSDVTQTIISNSSRGTIRPEWELLYAHYADLKGLNATYTGKMRDIINAASGGAEGGGGNYGSTSGGYDQLGYGTLTFRLK